METALPASPGRTRHACCAVASDSSAEVALVYSLLEPEFSEILAVTTEEDWRVLVQRDDVAVLVLAFHDLAAATDFHQRYTLARPISAGHQAQAVMLCSRKNVSAAYDLCRSQSIADYVLFWTITHDPQRLMLAMHRACDAFEQFHPAVTDSPTTREEAVVPLDLQVLVVEDHAFQLSVAVSVLNSAGMQATGVLDASSALTAIEASIPDLILLDVDMPGMSGIELLRLLKSTPRFVKIPVIMLTVTREREMVLEALREGAADFIVKPFDSDTMLQKIRRVSAREES